MVVVVFAVVESVEVTASVGITLNVVGIFQTSAVPSVLDGVSKLVGDAVVVGGALLQPTVVEMHEAAHVPSDAVAAVFDVKGDLGGGFSCFTETLVHFGVALPEESRKNDDLFGLGFAYPVAQTNGQLKGGAVYRAALYDVVFADGGFYKITKIFIKCGNAEALFQKFVFHCVVLSTLIDVLENFQTLPLSNWAEESIVIIAHKERFFNEFSKTTRKNYTTTEKNENCFSLSWNFQK